MSASQQMLIAGKTQTPMQVLFEGSSTEFSWVVPVDVTSICTVLIGPGRGSASGLGKMSGAGGDLVYSNNISVTPGETLLVMAGLGQSGAVTTNSSYIKRSTTVLVAAKGGGTSTDSSQINSGTGAIGTGGLGVLADSGADLGAGGGGAGGYGGNGGSANPPFADGNAGANGGGGSGASGDSAGSRGGDGGGTCPYGQGANGNGGVAIVLQENGGTGSPITGKPAYGSGASSGATGAPGANNGGSGCVRIIWGSGRSFPSTRTQDEFA